MFHVFQIPRGVRGKHYYNWLTYNVSVLVVKQQEVQGGLKKYKNTTCTRLLI